MLDPVTLRMLEHVLIQASETEWAPLRLWDWADERDDDPALEALYRTMCCIGDVPVWRCDARVLTGTKNA